MLVRWFASVTDRFLAADHGLLRLRFAARAVLSVALAVLVLSLARVPAGPTLLGAICAMICSTSMRTGSARERGGHILLYAPVMGASLTAATVLAPYPLIVDAVFVAVMFAGVYARRFDPVGPGLGLGGFMAYFFALFLRLPATQLPMMYLAVAVGLASCAFIALVVLRDTPASMLRRASLSIRAQLARLIDELATMLEDDERVPDADGLPRAVARQANRMHETTLRIEDSAEELGLDPQWQRQLIDAELSADRLARSTVCALAAELDVPTRTELAADLRGLHRFVDRDPGPALTLDTDELMHRIARYDIRGDPGRPPSKPAHHVLLVHRAIRELLLSVVQIRRTTERVLRSPRPRPLPGRSHREPTLEDVEQGLLPDHPAGVQPDRSAATDPDRQHAADRDHAAEPDRPNDHADRTLAAESSGTISGLPGTDTAPVTSAGDAPSHRELDYPTRAAVQAAIGGILAIAGGTLLSGQRWYWAAIAGFIVFAGTNSRGDLLVKGWRRMLGTLLGIVAGTVLATLLAGHPRVNLVLVLVCIFLAFYSLRVSYATMTFFITVMLGLLYDILGKFTPHLLVLRLEETVIGVTASTAAAMLVLPARTRVGVLAKLHDYFAALHVELTDAGRLLLDADRVSVIAATREVDRAADGVRTAIAPMLYRLSPSRVRRGQATRLLALTEESALAARNLARAAEPGALAQLPEAADTLHRLIDNVEVLLAATGHPAGTDHRTDADGPAATGTASSQARQVLVSGPALAPTVDARALVDAHDGRDGEPDRLRVLHLRRIVNSLDRLDKLLLGMAAPLVQTISIPPPAREPSPAAGEPSSVVQSPDPVANPVIRSTDRG